VCRLKMVIVLTCCALAQGCVGVMTLNKSTHTFEVPSVAARATMFHPVEGLAGVSKEGVAYHQNVLEPTRATNPTADWLRAHWGEPKSIALIKTEPREENWTYVFGLTWGGVIPCLIVPLPLAVPNGRKKVVFVLREGRVVSAQVTEQESDYGGFAPLSPEGPWSSF
jgi:uncharacterized protein YceK